MDGEGGYSWIGRDGSGSGRYGIIFEMGTGYFLKWVGGSVPFTSSGHLNIPKIEEDGSMLC